MKHLILLTFIAMSAFLTACTSTKVMPDGNVLGITTVKDNWDRSASYAGIYRPTGGQHMEHITGELISGPTVEGQTFTAAVGGLVPAIAQGEYAKDVAEIKCGKDGRGCRGGNTIVQAVAQQTQGQQTGVDVGVQTGSGCSYCGKGGKKY